MPFTAVRKGQKGGSEMLLFTATALLGLSPAPANGAAPASLNTKPLPGVEAMEKLPSHMRVIMSVALA